MGSPSLLRFFLVISIISCSLSAIDCKLSHILVDEGRMHYSFDPANEPLFAYNDLHFALVTQTSTDNARRRSLLDSRISTRNTDYSASITNSTDTKLIWSQAIWNSKSLAIPARDGPQSSTSYTNTSKPITIDGNYNSAKETTL